MKYFLKNYILFLVAISFVLTPVSAVVAETVFKSSHDSEPAIRLAKQSNPVKVTIRKSKRKKVSYKKSRARAKARRARIQKRRIALAKQRAVDLGEHYDGSQMPQLASNSVIVVNQDTGEVKYAKNTNKARSIASITKLMTAMVVLDAQQPMDETIYISNEDVDTIKGTRSRLAVGFSLHRSDMLQLALMSSENRAAFALSSNYPGGRHAFVKAMNAKASSLGLMNTHFAEPTGLMHENVSTAEDLYVLVSAAHQYPEIRAATTTKAYEIYIDDNEHFTAFKNTNSLVRDGELEIGLSKTGYINEAGRCLVMQTTMAGEPMIVVLLDAAGTNKRIGDVNRIRKWMEYNQREATITMLAKQTQRLEVVESASLEESGELEEDDSENLADSESLTPVARSGLAPKLLMSERMLDTTN